ncbi:MAG: phosphatidylglycerophosphatase A [bacterium]|nr:phosphatidylglycerophosphatase A [bacterium]
MGPHDRRAPSAAATASAPEGPARWVAIAASTSLGAGFLPWAPGTWGSAFALLIFVLFSPMPVWLLVTSGLALCALGVWSADVSEAVFEQADDGRIVIDEVVGQLLALAPLRVVFGPERAGQEIFWLVTGFVAFRVLDIAKPGPVGWVERHTSGGFGVMADDVVAGVIAALALVLALFATGLVSTGNIG